MVCNCNNCFNSVLQSILSSILPSVATFAGIWFACKTAKVDQKISVAPQRALIYSLYSLLIDCLEESLHKHESERDLRVGAVNSIIEEWMYAIEKDERMMMLTRTGRIPNCAKGMAIQDYEIMKASVVLTLSEANFYFPDRKVNSAIIDFIRFFEEVEALLPNPLEELDVSSTKQIDEKEIESQIRRIISTSVDVVELMKNDLTLK